MKNAAIYCRVSTDDQEKEGTSLQTQREACLAYCKQKDYQIVSQFAETYSGLTLERPKLVELRNLVRENEIDIVVVYCLDRLSRDPAHGAMIFQLLEEHSVRLEAVTETIENSDLGKLISYIRGFASKLEAEKIRERTMRGKLAHVKEGKLPQGTGVGIYGYLWDRAAKKRTVEVGEAEIVKEIFTRIASGQSLISIARTLNERGVPTKGSKAENRKHWHSLTLRRMVKNTFYIGKTYFGVTSRLSKSKTVMHPQDEWVLLGNVTPAIIGDELFHQANAQLDRPKVRTGRPKHAYLLRNHVYCAICGKPLVGHCLNKKHRYYQCSNARPYENSGKKCRALYIRADDLEELVWNKTRDVLSNPDIVLRNLAETTDNANMNSLETDIKELEKNLRTYEQRRNNLLDAIELGEFEKDEILDRLNNVKRLRQQDEATLNDLVNTRDHVTDLVNAKVKLNELYDQVLGNLKNSTPEIRALALDALDIKVYARGIDGVEIQGVIPLALPTTARTSGCLIRIDNDNSTGKEAVCIIPLDRIASSLGSNSHCFSVTIDTHLREVSRAVFV